MPSTPSGNTSILCTPIFNSSLFQLGSDYFSKHWRGVWRSGLVYMWEHKSGDCQDDLFIATVASELLQFQKKLYLDGKSRARCWAGWKERIGYADSASLHSGVAAVN